MGKYTVPDCIRKLKPKGTMVKFIKNNYYVYEIHSKKRDNGTWGITSGKIIGRITEKDGFIPNNNYLLSRGRHHD